MAGAALVLGVVQPVSAAPGQHGQQQRAPQGHGRGHHEADLTRYVDPFIGTAVSPTSGYAGNVNPGAQVPFGMVDFGPDTPRTDFNGSGGYLTKADATSGRINFFSLTHLNGPGCPGQGVVGMMPSATPQPVASEAGKPTGVGFQTANESASPGYYSVRLDNRVRAQLTATTRTGMARFTYPGKDSGYFSLDTRLNANSNLDSSAGKISADHTALSVAHDGRVLSGKTVAPAFCTPYGTQFNSNVYFYAELDKSLRTQPAGSSVNTVQHGAATLQYDLTDADPTLTMRVGISSVSVANAKLNLHTENPAATKNPSSTASTVSAADPAAIENPSTTADPAATKNLSSIASTASTADPAATENLSSTHAAGAIAASESTETAAAAGATENPRSRFARVRANADARWNERLDSVRIDEAARPDRLPGAERDRLTKFYTALYRVFGSPTVYSDVNGDYRSMTATPPYPDTVDTSGGVPDRPVANIADDTFVRPDGSTAHPRAHYTGLSMWDTYRSDAQLLAMLAPEVASDVMQSLVVDAQQCGAFPHWVDASDDSTPMAGDNALPVLAASYGFGATDFDVTTAARLVKQSVFDPTSACNGRASMPDAKQYLADGYYPDTTSTNIERYASDHAAAAFLSALPASVLADPSVHVTKADIAKLNDRAGWWKHIFDFDHGTIVARKAPTTPGVPGELEPGTYHESTEPNYFWSFGYAWPELIDAIGGDAAAVDRLNTLFSVDSALTKVPTLEQLNGGQESPGFYMGNEMGFPAPWAYNSAGKPASTQYVVQQLMHTAFGTGRAGLPGNDDMGAMSSWYVFAALGLFPTSQADAGLAVSTPQFPALTVRLGAHRLRIRTSRNASAAPFISSMHADGHRRARSWLPLDTLQTTHRLRYTLSATPTHWATTTRPTG